MKKIAEKLEQACFAMSGVLLVLICLVIGWQVFARKVLNDSPSWSEPVVMLMLLYCVMLATAAGCRCQLHLGLAWFRQKFPLGMRENLKLIEHSLCACFGCVMAYFGWSMAAKTAAYELTGIPVSMAAQYSSLVLGGILIVFFNVEQVVSNIDRDNKNNSGVDAV